jgi:hypothetical protein
MIAPSALAFTLGGGAQAEPGQVRLVSDFSNAATLDNASWIDLDVPAGLTFAGITTLATQFNVTGDDCGAGSPRFQIAIGGNNMFVYLGPSPSFTGCTPNTWTSGRVTPVVSTPRSTRRAPSARRGRLRSRCSAPRR